MSEVTLPVRSRVPVRDTWDLSKLFTSDEEWRVGFDDLVRRIDGYAAFRGNLGKSVANIRQCLDFDTEFERLADRVGTYAMLRECEDTTNGTYQAMKGRVMAAGAKAAEASSFIRPELLAIPEEKIKGFLDDPVLEPYRLLLERLLRYRPHTLHEREERLLAMQAELAAAPQTTFGQLTNADMKFGSLELSPGHNLPLSHGTLLTFLESPDRTVREKAFRQYYAEFADHANTLAATLAGSVHGDVYRARVRNFPSSRAAALFPDRVPESVYDNLIAAVRKNLPTVHRYFDVRRRALGLADIHAYDTYVPVVPGFHAERSWDQAVDLVLESLAPLGVGYVDTLAQGLRGRWCDRYENKGKRSGAFSSGCYDSDPYILMNYRADALDHVYTLTHEAGHSMHTHYSNRSQPFQYAGYTIFVAEVASTFNEQFLTHLLLRHAKSDRERAFYLNREIDGIRATVVRQTMFAEFEQVIHTLAEKDEPLTLDRFRDEYRRLLEAYFGPGFVIDDELSLECLRIPHFYRAFYVYKYATGLSAAVTLAERVANGGHEELEAYLRFLRAGCSKDPLDLLRDAGVDLETPVPVDRCLARFGDMVNELDSLLSK